jgi:hypothetical protein
MRSGVWIFGAKNRGEFSRYSGSASQSVPPMRLWARHLAGVYGFRDEETPPDVVAPSGASIPSGPG